MHIDLLSSNSILAFPQREFGGVKTAAGQQSGTVILHAENLLHGTLNFTLLLREAMLRIFLTPLKFHPQPGLNLHSSH